LKTSLGAPSINDVTHKLRKEDVAEVIDRESKFRIRIMPNGKWKDVRKLLG
jgi:hypothetical protein